MARRWREILVIVVMALVLVGAVFLVKIQVSPWYVGMGDDSGLFAYAGELIADGALLYQDIWDTKPPGIFYLNALAISLGGSTPWSIWWFELIWFSFTMILLMIILIRLTSVLAGFSATILVTLTALHPAYVSGGNYTEVYALLPQTLTLAAVMMYFKTNRTGWVAVIGVLTAAAFLLKPTYIALGLASLATALVAWRRSPDRARAMRLVTLFVVGFAAPVLLAGLYFTLQGGLDELWAAVFKQNVLYVQEGISIRSIYGTGRKFVLEQPLATLVVLTVASLALFARGGVAWLRKPSTWPLPGLAGNSPPAYRRWVLLTAFIALPLEVAFVAVSGRNFGHYFLTPLPAISVAIAFLLMDVQVAFRRRSEAGAWFSVSVATLAVLLLAWGVEVFAKESPELAHMRDLVERPIGGPFWTDELEQYVIENAEPNEAVLAWGYNPGLHFLTGRRAPTRYLFHAQLLVPGPAGENRFNQFLTELEADPPVLIVAQQESQHAIPHFANDSEELCPSCTAEALLRLQKLRALVEADYVLDGEVGGWLVYRRQ